MEGPWAEPPALGAGLAVWELSAEAGGSGAPVEGPRLRAPGGLGCEWRSTGSAAPTGRSRPFPPSLCAPGPWRRRARLGPGRPRVGGQPAFPDAGVLHLLLSADRALDALLLDCLALWCLDGLGDGEAVEEKGEDREVSLCPRASSCHQARGFPFPLGRPSRSRSSLLGSRWLRPLGPLAPALPDRSPSPTTPGQ